MATFFLKPPLILLLLESLSLRLGLLALLSALG